MSPRSCGSSMRSATSSNGRGKSVRRRSKSYLAASSERLSAASARRNWRHRFSISTRAGRADLSFDEFIAAHPAIADELRHVRRRDRRSRQLGSPGAASVAERRGAGELRRPQGLHIRCPHCASPVELLADTPEEDVTCRACGSTFCLVDRERSTRRGGQPPVDRAIRTSRATRRRRLRYGVEGARSGTRSHRRAQDSASRSAAGRGDRLLLSRSPRRRPAAASAHRGRSTRSAAKTTRCSSSATSFAASRSRIG